MESCYFNDYEYRGNKSIYIHDLECKSLVTN